MAFYDIFEKLCKEKGVSPTQATRSIGLHQPVAAMWKKRGSTPNAYTVQKLADYFGVSVDYLLGNIPAGADGTGFGGGSAPGSGFGDGSGYGGPLLPADARRVVEAMDGMNQEGRGKVVDYAEDLEASGRYIKNNSAGKKQA